MLDLISIPRFRLLFRQTNAAIVLVKLVISDTLPRHYESLVIFLSELLSETFEVSFFDSITLPHLFKVFYSVLSDFKNQNIQTEALLIISKLIRVPDGIN